MATCFRYLHYQKLRVFQRERPHRLGNAVERTACSAEECHQHVFAVAFCRCVVCSSVLYVHVYLCIDKTHVCIRVYLYIISFSLLGCFAGVIRLQKWTREQDPGQVPAAGRFWSNDVLRHELSVRLNGKPIMN